MPASVNRVTLLGRLNRRGVQLSPANGGTPCASFTLDLVEVSGTGQEFTTYIDCQAWGKKAEASRAIAPGTLVLFEGRLKRQKQGEHWETIVAGFELTAVITETSPRA